MSYSIRDVFHLLDLMVVLVEQVKPKNSADHKVQNYTIFFTGRWPEKSVRIVLSLLQNLAANA